MTEAIGEFHNYIRHHLRPTRQFKRPHLLGCMLFVPYTHTLISDASDPGAIFAFSYSVRNSPFRYHEPDARGEYGGGGGGRENFIDNQIDD
jgi:hypothetical protein